MLQSSIILYKLYEKSNKNTKNKKQKTEKLHSDLFSRIKSKNNLIIGNIVKVLNFIPFNTFI